MKAPFFLVGWGVVEKTGGRKLPPASQPRLVDVRPLRELVFLGLVVPRAVDLDALQHPLVERQDDLLLVGEVVLVPTGQLVDRLEGELQLRDGLVGAPVERLHHELVFFAELLHHPLQGTVAVQRHGQFLVQGLQLLLGALGHSASHPAMRTAPCCIGAGVGCCRHLLFAMITYKGQLYFAIDFIAGAGPIGQPHNYPLDRGVACLLVVTRTNQRRWGHSRTGNRGRDQSRSGWAAAPAVPSPPGPR